jgi:hypothetical protein
MLHTCHPLSGKALHFCCTTSLTCCMSVVQQQRPMLAATSQTLLEHSRSVIPELAQCVSSLGCVLICEVGCSTCSLTWTF